MPYFIAPETQKHVAALMWFSESSKRVIDTGLVAARAADYFSHDNLFHTLLGLMQVKTSLYEKQQDILAPKELN
jgi:lipid A ethanolaminephosphotransferase